jgi:hypothetical protein
MNSTFSVLVFSGGSFVAVDRWANPWVVATRIAHNTNDEVLSVSDIASSSLLIRGELNKGKTDPAFLLFPDYQEPLMSGLRFNSAAIVAGGQ